MNTPPQGRPPSARLVFLARPPFTVQQGLELYAASTGDTSPPSPGELEHIRQALEESEAQQTTNEEDENDDDD